MPDRFILPMLARDCPFDVMVILLFNASYNADKHHIARNDALAYHLRRWPPIERTNDVSWGRSSGPFHPSDSPRFTYSLSVCSAWTHARSHISRFSSPGLQR
jgi:hypothetical protein